MSLQLMNSFEMRTFILLLVLSVAWVMPLQGHCQDEDPNPLDEYIEQVNARCPIDLGEEWGLNSLTAEGDTVVFALKVPVVLKSFLPPLVEDKSNTRRLWKRQLEQYSEIWSPLFDLLKKEGRPFKLVLMFNERTIAATLSYSQDDLDL